ncbi:matrixin family metalloprotease, partial [Myxococcota bacterium]
MPLKWPQACVAFSVQEDGSQRREISHDAYRELVVDALYRWSEADCGGGKPPSLQIYDRSPVTCNQAVYNKNPDVANANVWMFQDEAWPHEGTHTLALTTVTYNFKTGEIYDADVEVNSAANDITVGDGLVEYDLKSIVMHEAGHALGLSHTPETSATMYWQYGESEINKRALSRDDTAGICAIYPPGERRGKCNPTPRHGF